jgi:hypothetical protein
MQCDAQNLAGNIGNIFTDIVTTNTLPSVVRHPVQMLDKTLAVLT